MEERLGVTLLWWISLVRKFVWAQKLLFNKQIPVICNQSPYLDQNLQVEAITELSIQISICISPCKLLQPMKMWLEAYVKYVKPECFRGHCWSSTLYCHHGYILTSWESIFMRFVVLMLFTSFPMPSFWKYCILTAYTWSLSFLLQHSQDKPQWWHWSLHSLIVYWPFSVL